MARRSQLKWHVIAGALAASLAPDLAQAGGLFDFLFGESREPPPAAPQYYAEPPAPLAPVAPAPLAAESVRQGGGSTGHAVAYCVRLCDGEHFPMEHLSNATPVETCRAMCPASRTKVFFGSDIDAAVARDGARYADLDTAFLYRKQLVAKCTCNGKDAFGLAPFDLSSDPTLRPGDIVATKDGLLAYNGKAGKTDAFTPVDAARVEAELNPVAAPRPAPGRREATLADDEDPGTITHPPAPSAPPLKLSGGRAAQ